MYSYRAYGLNLASNIELPELLPIEAPQDVTIQVVDETAPGLTEVEQGYIHLDIEESVFFDPRAGRFTLRQGKEIIVQPNPERDLSRIRPYLVNGMMTILLYQRGILVLHGSAIAIENSVVGFIGASGRGKSSIAAALYAKGHRLFSDDVIPIRFSCDRVEVFPGYPQVKVSEEVAACLGYNATTLVAEHPESGEASFQANQSFSSSSLPLKQLYVLEPDHAISIAPLSAKDAMIAMMQNSLPTMWNQPQTPQQFVQITSLASQVPFYRLQRSQDLSALPKLAEIVEAHVLNNIPALIS